MTCCLRCSGKRERLLLYVLFEHQSKPDRWMRFRLLQYCCRIWADALRADEQRPELPPIVPVVFYQGERRRRHAREFAELFADDAERGIMQSRMA